MEHYDDNLHFLKLALEEARKSPPKSTNFCVGACLVSTASAPPVLITGFTLECEGNTHAEQCCFIKLAQSMGCNEETLGEHIPSDVVLYTTMEPCNKRSAGNVPCIDRILGLKTADGKPAIQTVCVGVAEPETFVGVNEGRKKLEEAGIKFIHVAGLEGEILKVATAGHEMKKK